MNLKVCVFVLILLAVKTSYQYEMDEDTLELMQMLHDTCVKEINIDENLISEARKGNFANDPKLMCYMKCLFVTLGPVDDKQHLDISALLDLYPPEAQEIHGETIRKCGFIEFQLAMNNIH